MNNLGNGRNGRGVRPGTGRRAAPPFPKGRVQEPEEVATVRSILGDRPRARDMPIEYLHLVQDAMGWLPESYFQALAEELQISMAEVYEVASFHSALRNCARWRRRARADNRSRVRVDRLRLGRCRRADRRDRAGGDRLPQSQGSTASRRRGGPVPKGIAVFSAEEAVAAAKQLGGPIWVAKAQIHAGGRGKGGGVKAVKSVEDVRDEAKRMLGTTLVTHQTGSQGKIEAMQASGIRAADSPAALGTALVEALGG